MEDMAWWATLSIGIAILVFLFLTGVPIFLAFFVMISVGVVVAFGDAAFGMVVNSVYETGTTAALGTVPLFTTIPKAGVWRLAKLNKTSKERGEALHKLARGFGDAP